MTGGLGQCTVKGAGVAVQVQRWSRRGMGSMPPDTQTTNPRCHDVVPGVCAERTVIASRSRISQPHHLLAVVFVLDELEVDSSVDAEAEPDEASADDASLDWVR